MNSEYTIIKRFDLPWYTEGPVADAHGIIYFTTLSGGKVMCETTPNGQSAIWATGCKPNGQFICPNGDHLVCDSGNASISRYDRDGNFLRYDVKGKCGGRKIHVPNDLVCDREGGIYFTDSIRQAGKVCYCAPDGTQRIISEALDFPNGIALSADEKRLLVAESYQNRILCLPLEGPGTASGRWEVFAELPKNSTRSGFNLPDGIKLRGDGTLWVAHYGMHAIQVLDTDGTRIRSIPVDFPLPSNLCFSGSNLIVTGGYLEPGPGGVLIITLEDNLVTLSVNGNIDN